MLYLAVSVYATAMTLANLSLAMFGPVVVPVNAFVLIGLDLALRDWLHCRLTARQMLALIAVSGALTYVLNPSAAHVALASASAFAGAAVVDWAVFARTRGSWPFRANASNVAGAAVDSILFALLAGIPLSFAPGMFAAKVAGGAAWTWALARVEARRAGK